MLQDESGPHRRGRKGLLAQHCQARGKSPTFHYQYGGAQNYNAIDLIILYSVLIVVLFIGNVPETKQLLKELVSLSLE